MKNNKLIVTETGKIGSMSSECLSVYTDGITSGLSYMSYSEWSGKGKSKFSLNDPTIFGKLLETHTLDKKFYDGRKGNKIQGQTWGNK